MRIWLKRFIILISIAVLLSIAMSGYCHAITANVVMKVSRTAQDSVVSVGEDLAIDVDIQGVVPSVYRWYFENEPVDGADQQVFNIYSAQLEDAGLYRMDAFNDEGKMLVSIEFSVRVIDDTMPKAGDGTLDFTLVAGIAGIFALTLAALLIARRRRLA